MSKIKISASLVIYNTSPDAFAPAVKSYLSSIEDAQLVIFDNSEFPLSHEILEHPRVRYVFNNKNIGFGAAHNRSFNALATDSDFHLILNPDVHFGPEVIPRLLHVMHEHPSVGAIMPKVLYTDGTTQRLCKLLPTPFYLFARRFIKWNLILKYINHRYELFDLPDDRLFDVPSISGCFMFVRSVLYKKLGGFDERYFMYMEDVDLVRRLGDFSRIVYDPSVSIYHGYAKGSYKNKRLLRYHLLSALRYFNTWGWFCDPVRRLRNAEVLNTIREC